MFKSSDIFLLKSPPHRDFIALVNPVPRMGESVGQFSIIGQQQQSRRFCIKTTHREKTWFIRVIHQIDGASTSFGIPVRAYRSAGFEEHHVDVASRTTDHSVTDGDAILFGIDPGGQGAHELAVDGNMPVLDQLFAGPSRGHSSLGQDLLQSWSPGVVGVGMGGFLGGSRAHDGHSRVGLDSFAGLGDALGRIGR